MTKIVLPPNVTSIEEYAFEEDEKLAGFYGNLASEDNRFLILDGKLLAFAPAGLTTYSIPEGVKEIGGWVFSSYGLTDITIPDGVETIGSMAFAGCRLTTVTIPKSVTSIGYAFNCKSLESVTVEATTPPALGRFAFGYVGNEYDARKLEIEINVPKASVDTYKNAEGWKDYAAYIRGI